MEINMKNYSKDLISTVHKAEKHLKTMNEKTVKMKPISEKWSKIEILGHLIDSALNNLLRFVAVQCEDDPVFSRYDQEKWVNTQKYQEFVWERLIELWKTYNLHIAFLLARIPGDKKHLNIPDGAGLVFRENKNVDLEYLVDDYIYHLKHHLGQIGVR